MNSDDMEEMGKDYDHLWGYGWTLSERSLRKECWLQHYLKEHDYETIFN